ncbi:MAG: M48 family metalloprotease [Nitrospinota bacterium]
MKRTSRTTRGWGARGLRAAVIAAFLALGVLIGLPPSSDAQGISVISEKTEKKIGKRMDPVILKQMGYYRDPFLQDYVRRVGQKLARVADRRAISYKFRVVDDYRENAMAVPGGYIYITRGMLAVLNSEAELAGVLGHEIGHVTQRHGARQMTKALGAQFLTLAAAAGGALAGGGAIAPAITLTQSVMNIVIQGHGRAFELEADEKGLYYAWKAGYDPREATKFMRRLRQLERLRGIGYHSFGATHPGTTLRILKLDELASALVRRGQKLTVKADQYKAQLSGLTYGEAKEHLRLRVYKATGGETVRDVAGDILSNPNFALEISLLNDLEEDTVLKPGQKVKLIIRK